MSIAYTSHVAVPSAINAPVAKAKSAPAAKAEAKAKAAAKDGAMGMAQRGVAAAAALGYDVLPKAPSSTLEAPPALGLRPTIKATSPMIFLLWLR